MSSAKGFFDMVFREFDFEGFAVCKPSLGALLVAYSKDNDLQAYLDKDNVLYFTGTIDGRPITEDDIKTC